MGNRSLAHIGYNLYWPFGTDNRKDMQVIIAVRKDIPNTIIVENQTDLISHPYCICLDIKEIDGQTERRLRKTRVINLYDNKIGRGQLWEGSSPTPRRAIQDICWRSIIRGRVLIVGDMNAHSPIWNPHCHQRQNAGPLEELIETYELLVNNNTDFPTRPGSRGMSIIDLALTSPGLGLLRVGEIPEEYPSLSDHELILLEWEDMEGRSSEMQQPAMKGWSIQNLLEDENLRRAAKDEWEKFRSGHNCLTPFSTKDDLDTEVEWFEKSVTELLNNHAKVTRVSAYSKRWWNKEVAEARSSWAKAKRDLGRDETRKQELKQARNSYYRTIRKAKRLSWQNFLQGKDDSTSQQSQSLDKNRCWTALKYTKPLQFKTTPALRDPDGNIATSMKAKEALVCKSAFPKPPASHNQEPSMIAGTAHLKITEEKIAYALMSQSATKAPGPDKINFQIIRMLWEWDKEQITGMIQQAIRLGYHPKAWKRARGILLEKGGKRDFGLVRSYRVISLLNCMGKILEKVIAEQLSEFCEAYSKLHPGQMGARKERSAIDAVAMLVHTVQENWSKKKLAGALFMDVKGAFDHVSKSQLLTRMIDLGIDTDLVAWTKSFLTDRKIQLVIDGHDNKERDIETGIPQGSPVSPILFLIYISGVFEAVTENNPTVTSLSFVDDLGFIASGTSVQEISKTLETVASSVLRWGLTNAVTYDTSKTEAVLFSKSHRQRLNKQLRETKIQVGNEKIMFNKEATRWLGVWLDSQLKFTSHINERVKRARTAEIQIKGLTKTQGLAPGLVRRIQLAVVQSIALYGENFGGKDKRIMRIPFNSSSTGKHDRSLGCTLVPRYIRSYAKRAWLQLLLF